jgi:hypothetical protein
MKFSILALIVPVIIALSACSEVNPPEPPVLPEITANISGEVALNYEGSGASYVDDTARTMTCGSSADINNKKYGLSILFNFKDSITTGILPFANKNNAPDGSYAVGAFDDGNGESRETYISTEGTVIITKIEGTVVHATFSFTGIGNKNNKVIIVQNGVIEMIK